jgi:hypothetical protein
MTPYRPAISKKLNAKMEKIYRKDRQLYDALTKKFRELLNDPHHYKPLRYDLKGFYRAHIEFYSQNEYHKAESILKAPRFSAARNGIGSGQGIPSIKEVI